MRFVERFWRWVRGAAGGFRAGGWRWAPCAAVVIWLGWQALDGHLRLDMMHLGAAGLAGAGWLYARRQGTSALVVLALLAPLAWHFGWALPAVRGAAQAAAQQGRYVRVEGTVRHRAASVPGSRVRLLLGRAWVGSGDEQRALSEVEVDLAEHSVWSFPYRGRIRIGGVLQPAPAGTRLTGQRLRLTFGRAEHVLQVPPIRAWNGEALRLHLRDRAAYYLSPSALAVYLPVVLGLRERDTPEARQVAGAFRRVGVAHLFAISGLHVGLLYGLFALLLHWGLGWLGWLRGSQGWVHTPAVRRGALLATVWLYIALIGFPLPAVRAALMGTLLVWNEQWGTRSPPLYILALAALAVLAPDPSQLYDVSFQLSFLAYLFLLCALGLHRPLLGGRGSRSWSRWPVAALEGAWLNLWLTALITAGLWPLVAATFGRVSLLVFLGNLVMVPLLGLAVLPAGLAGLAVSLLSLGTSPGGALERSVFASLDVVLQGWVWLVERLDALSAYGVVPVRPAWPPQVFAAYYALLLGTLVLLLHRRGRARTDSGGAL